MVKRIPSTNEAQELNLMRSKKQLILGLMAGLGLAQGAMAFSVWGPLEAWQTPALDYGTRYYYGEVENGGTKILGAGSRVAVPVITYGFDYTFTEFFGEEGVKAVDQAMAILNGLPNASAASAGLNEFVEQGNQQINYTAQALQLIDLKSVTLQIMLEHLGLLGETHIYDLNSRVLIPNTTCEFFYYVVNRNYDPVTYDPSTFVNGVQYGYNIVDFCPAVDEGDAVEYPKDTTEPANAFTAVATPQGLESGGYYLNLTRDDFGGLRWLYRRNHLVNQGIDPNSFLTSFGSSAWNAFGTGAAGGTNLISTNTLVGGVEKVRFVKVAYDSFEGTLFNPVSYNYSLPVLVNGKVVNARFTRVITQPDIIFTTADLVDRTLAPPGDELYGRSTTFQASPLTSLGGGPLPNVILPQQLVTFNNANPIYFNESPTFLSDLNVLTYPIYTWGSFGSSSAPPVVYPSGQSIEELENEILNGQATTTQVAPTTFAPYGTTVAGTVTFLGNY